jgi:predicted nuclease of predicted toxin-antitoxin system
MTIWVDAHLSPGIAKWIRESFPVDAIPLRDLNLRDADDADIFRAARDADAVVMTKDSDFQDLVQRLGTPPRVIWITCGNTSNARLRVILSKTLPDAIALLESGERVVEIGDL